MTAQAHAMAPSRLTQVSISDYVRVVILLTLFCIGLAAVVRTGATTQPETASLMAPMFAMFALTAVVFLIMVVVRNATVLRGITSPRYYLAYAAEPPPDWVERPARTFNNLMQVPPLFYVVCTLMLISGRLDQAQVALAWIFVVTRALHAIVYIGWNYLPLRFATFVASFITLAVLWARLMNASQAICS